MRRTPYSTTAAEPISGPFATRWWWLPDLGFATMRAVTGLLVAWQGARVLFGALMLPGMAWPRPPVPWTEPWIDAVVFLAGGMLLMLGLFTRVAAALLAVLVALTHLTGTGRPAWTWSGAELAIMYCAVLVTFALAGPGLYSLEWFVLSQVDRRRRRNTVSMSPWIRKQYRRRELAR